MSVFSLDVDRSKWLKYGITPRQAQRATRTALESMATHWWDTFLPLHFGDRASQRYGYTARKGEKMQEGQKGRTRTYAYRKRAKVGHSRPLEFTGEGRRLAIGIKQIRASSKEARVVLPRKYNLRHPKSQVNMRQEITRILPEESRELLAVGQQALRLAIQRPQ